VALARQVRRQGNDRGGDRAGALQDAARDRGPDVCGEGRQQTAEREHDQSRVDHRLAAPAVRCHAERDLQQRLRQPVGAECDTDQRQVAAALQRARVHGEHRQNEEQAEHAQAENPSQTEPGAQFRCGHAIARHCGRHCGMKLGVEAKREGWL
jgi:hypothetical protein